MSHEDKNICGFGQNREEQECRKLHDNPEIIFDDREIYERVKKSGAITREAIARAYNVEPEKILDFMFFDPGMGIKANYQRPIPSADLPKRMSTAVNSTLPSFSLEIPWRTDDDQKRLRKAGRFSYKGQLTKTCPKRWSTRLKDAFDTCGAVIAGSYH